MTEVRAGSREAAALVEKHLISPDLARGGGFLIASKDGGAAVMELIGGLIPEKEENKEERP